MEPNLFHQELARVRYAEALRAASTRRIVVHKPAAPRATRRERLLRRLRPALGS